MSRSRISTWWRYVTGADQAEALDKLVSGEESAEVASLKHHLVKTREMVNLLTRRLRDLERARDEDRHIIEQLVESNNGMVHELAELREAKLAFESEAKTTFERFEDPAMTEVLKKG